MRNQDGLVFCASIANQEYKRYAQLSLGKPCRTNSLLVLRQSRAEVPNNQNGKIGGNLLRSTRSVLSLHTNRNNRCWPVRKA